MKEERNGRRPKSRLKRWLRRIVIGIAVLAGLLFAASWYIDYRGEAHPPPLDSAPAILSQAVTEKDGIKRIGGSWLTERQGILQMALSGDPFTLGYTNSALTQPYLKEQEASLMRLIRSHVPSGWRLWLLKKYVTWRNRDLPAFIPVDLQMEVYGLSRGYRDPFPEIGPLYHRLLNYHAAHDISHAVMDHPLVGCTSFAAWGDHTASGRLLVGRNFDFQAGECFDRNKLVTRVKPDRGLGFISVSWPGMAGVVSGINDQRIAITINAASSRDKRTIGMPVSLVIRQVLQYAGSLDEAIRMIRQSEVFVADSYLIADGKSGTAVVVEKTPSRCAVRKPTARYIICSNHFLSDELSDDPGNRAYMVEGTSVVRHERIESLVLQARGKLTPEMAATILRDRHVSQMGRPVLGHPAAINSLIATHSVVIDATAGIIWVSQPPHQLGGYVPFSLDRFESPVDVGPIPPDPLLGEGGFERYRKASDLVAEGNRLAKTGDSDAAEAKFKEAIALNPSLYLPYLLAGEAAFEAERFAEAKAYLLQAKARFPAYESERSGIAERLERMERDGETTRQ